MFPHFCQNSDTSVGMLNSLSEKGKVISEHIIGPLVAVSRSTLIKALDRCVKMLGL